MLDTFNAKFVEEMREIGVGQLNFLAVHRGGPAMRGMLGPSGGRMTQSEKRFGNVARHRDVDVAGGIIPIDFEAEIAGTGPVFGESIFGCKGIEKVISIGLGKEFDTEIVDSESKRRASISVAPETRGLGDGEVSVRSKVRFELVICQDGSLFEAIHAFADLEVDETFGVEVLISEMVLVDDFLGNITAVDTHILVDEHVGNEEKSFKSPVQ